MAIGVLLGVRERLLAFRDGEQMSRGGEIVDRVFDAQRARILAARRDGVYSTETLGAALARVDAMQIGMGMTRRGHIDEEP